jgi:hypothetical protein
LIARQFKLKEYLALHGLAEGEVTPEARACFNEIQDQKNMTRPCTVTMGKDEVLASG